MKSRFFLPVLAIFTCIFLHSCVKDEVTTVVKHYSDEQYATLSKTLNLSLSPTDYTLQLPDHLGGSRVNAESSQATLGRVLFYDKKLSANNTVSCASCHKAEKGFSDDVAFSEGFNGEVTERNSLALGAFPSFNAYYGFGTSRLFWDNRAANVSEQAEQTLQNPIEMGMNLHTLSDKLMEEDYYKILFDKAFPPDYHRNMSTESKILTAIDVFVSSIGTFKTKFDEQMKTHNNPELNFGGFSVQENIGKEVFNANCAKCHNLGSGSSTSIVAANNGLDHVSDDRGLAGFSGQNSDEGVFKVPMLRNIAVTGPYMHDGRFATLEEVVEHYNSGVVNHPNLHEFLKTGNQPKHLDLNESEKAALVAFLHTLTDVASTTQEKYLNPFK